VEKYIRDMLAILPASAEEIIQRHRHLPLLLWYAKALGELSAHYDTARAALKCMLPADPPPDDDEADPDATPIEADLVGIAEAAGMTS